MSISIKVRLLVGASAVLVLFGISIAIAIGQINHILAVLQGTAAQSFDIGNLERARMILYVLVTVSLVIAAITAGWIAVSVGGGLASALRLTSAMEQGDLTATSRVTLRDEFGILLNRMNGMIQSLCSTVQNVKTSAEVTAMSSRHVSNAAEQLSETSIIQASHVQEITATMDHLSLSVEKTSASAQSTSLSVREALDAAEQSTAIVEEAIAAMKQITEKITIIEEISKQTNMLALNAAIEAARAGTHGAGFSVVAAEVRKLAQRSNAASEDISSLSSRSMQLAADSQAVLHGLLPKVRTTFDLIEEVTQANEDQTRGIHQIARAITRLDEITQQNAAAAEELAATAEELSAQSEQLDMSIAFFHTGETDTYHGAPLLESPPVYQLEAAAGS